MRFRQCTLRRRESVGREVITTAFLPEKFARLEQVVKLRQADGVWSDGWRIEHIGTTMEQYEMPDVHVGIRRHRQATGDALPRRDS